MSQKSAYALNIKTNCPWNFRVFYLLFLNQFCETEHDVNIDYIRLRKTNSILLINMRNNL